MTVGRYLDGKTTDEDMWFYGFAGAIATFYGMMYMLAKLFGFDQLL